MKNQTQAYQNGWMDGWEHAWIGKVGPKEDWGDYADGYHDGRAAQVKKMEERTDPLKTTYQE